MAVAPSTTGGHSVGVRTGTPSPTGPASCRSRPIAPSSTTAPHDANTTSLHRCDAPATCTANTVAAALPDQSSHGVVGSCGRGSSANADIVTSTVTSAAAPSGRVPASARPTAPSAVAVTVPASTQPRARDHRTSRTVTAVVATATAVTTAAQGSSIAVNDAASDTTNAATGTAAIAMTAGSWSIQRRSMLASSNHSTRRSTAGRRGGRATSVAIAVAIQPSANVVVATAATVPRPPATIGAAAAAR
ncbi:unannotated protein [freshwater metagenome]|uniref:Unannotated protein n=1 Tax=freshwater metagenome TaxID=449393 RepID=A0A6J6FSL2_9ZZZZ